MKLICLLISISTSFLRCREERKRRTRPLCVSSSSLLEAKEVQQTNRSTLLPPPMPKADDNCRATFVHWGHLFLTCWSIKKERREDDNVWGRCSSSAWIAHWNWCVVGQRERKKERKKKPPPHFSFLLPSAPTRTNRDSTRSSLSLCLFLLPLLRQQLVHYILGRETMTESTIFFFFFFSWNVRKRRGTMTSREIATFLFQILKLVFSDSLPHTNTMPSSSNVDTRTFKQRKSFGETLVVLPFLPHSRSFLLATRKEEVAGIRSKFPNSTFASAVAALRAFLVVSEIPVIVERYHKEKDLPVLGNCNALAPPLTFVSFSLKIRRSSWYLKNWRCRNSWRLFGKSLPARGFSLSDGTRSEFRNRMQLNANQAFYLLVNNKSIASMSTSMAEIYRDDKVRSTSPSLAPLPVRCVFQDDDGFLYMTYASQEMFGGLDA